MATRRGVSPIILLVVLAGCVEAEPPDDRLAGPEARPAPQLSFKPPVQATRECPYNCYEPSVAADSAGRIFVTGAAGGEIGISDDGGASFRAIAPPPFPAGAPATASAGDALVQSNRDGRLYYSALVWRSSTLLDGIQVAWSDDAGESWPGNVYLSALALVGGSDPSALLEPAAVVAPDRQWLGFGPDETLYLTYNQVPSGIWIARSDDGGATWGGWTRAAPLERRAGGVGQSGPPVVDSTGRVFVPALSLASGAVEIFVSEDRGATWTPRVVHATPGRSGSWFPIAAVGADDTVHVAFYYNGGDVLVSSSTTHGANWGQAKLWGTGAVTSPWIVAGADALAVSWLDGQNVRFARGLAGEGPSVDVVVAEREGAANTDFAHFAILPDGRAFAAWAPPAKGEILIAAEQTVSET